MAKNWLSLGGMDKDPSLGGYGKTGLRIHNMTNAQQPTASSSNNGLVAYDTTNNQLEAVINGSWTAIGVAGSGDNTLDESYDQGGAGAGRTITADSGAVAITVSNNSNNQALVLTQSDSTNNPVVLTLSNAGTGNDVTADNWSMTKSGHLTIANILTSAGITDSGTAALTTLTATTGTITNLTATTFYNPAIASASGGNVALTVDAAGSGTIGIATVSTGAVTIGQSTTLSSGAGLTLSNGNITLSAGTVSITAGSGDGDALTIVPIVTQAGILFTPPSSYNLSTGLIDINASTGSGSIFDFAASSTYTGTVLKVNMTNAVGGTAMALTGAGTRTAGLVTVTDVPTTSAPTLDLNLTMANAPAIDIDCAGTGNGGTIDIAYSAAFTGDAIIVNMTNAVGANCLDLTGAGTRTVPFITITDVPTTSAPSIDLNITPGAGVQAGIDIDVAGTQAADIISIDFSAAFTGDALNITMTNGGAGAQAIVVDGSLAASGAIVSLSTSGILTANGSVLTSACSTQPGSANTGTCGRFLDTGSAQATSYAVQIDSTNNEALTITTGKSHFVESVSFLQSNKEKVAANYVQAGGSANAITVAANADTNGTNIPLTDGLVLYIDLNTLTLQAGANTLDYIGGGAVAITRATSTAANLSTAFAANGVITVMYSSGATAWLCLTQ